MATVFSPLATTEKSAASESLKTLVFLNTVRTSQDARKLLSGPTLASIDATVGGTQKLKLDEVKDHLTNPNGNLEAAYLETFGMMHAVLTDVEKAAKNDPNVANSPDYIAAVAQYKALQQSGATLQLQKRQLELADATLALASTLVKVVDLVPDQQVVTSKSGKTRPESINSPLKTALAEVADYLANARLMAENANVFGAAYELMALLPQVVKLVDERWKKLPNAANFAADKLSIDNLLKQADTDAKNIMKASAELHKSRSDISKQPHQTAITIQQASGNFAQQMTTNVVMCQETKNQMDATATKEAETYQELEGWFYQSLRTQTPSTARKKDVNVGFKPGKSPDPVVMSLIPKKKLEADHIVAMKIITQHPNYQFLSTDEKLTILNRADNFTGLSRSPNASKSDRTYADWKTYLTLDTKGFIGTGSMQGEQVDVAHLNSLITEEQRLTPIIHKEIDNLVLSRLQALNKEYPQ
jgi:hypothetical protein